MQKHIPNNPYIIAATPPPRGVCCYKTFTIDRIHPFKYMEKRQAVHGVPLFLVRICAVKQGGLLCIIFFADGVDKLVWVWYNIYDPAL